jgi:HlyD family secretion protein
VAFGSTKTDNVVTYITWLEVDNADLSLRPGMTATATITATERNDVLLVPNTALRFTPGCRRGGGAAGAVVGRRHHVAADAAHAAPGTRRSGGRRRQRRGQVCARCGCCRTACRSRECARWVSATAA